MASAPARRACCPRPTAGASERASERADRRRHPRHGAAYMADFLKGGGDEKWLGELGVTSSPVTRAGLATALQFFHMRMPALPRAMQLAFLKGMDLHRPVRQVTLAPSDVVAA